MTTIDLNADMGESFGRWTLGDDAALLGIITSANVACGFHAGDPTTIRHTVEGAARHGVTVGAHVAYPDLVGFGRRAMAISEADLSANVIYQIGALDALAASAGTHVCYVKPHGALYNTIAHDEAQAHAVLSAVRAVSPELPLMTPPGSVIASLAHDAGHPIVVEVFADRAYTPQGTLVARSQPGAVLSDPTAIATRVVRLALEGVVEAIDGTVIHLEPTPGSVCVHGDSPDAVAIAAAVRTALEQAGVDLAPAVRP